MSGLLRRINDACAWVWKRISAAVALALIIAALFVGYAIGTPDAGAPDGAHLGHTHDQVADATGGSTPMYTCSMHPSVRLEDPDAKCPICFMDLIPVRDDDGGEGSERRITISEHAAATAHIETREASRFFPEAQVRLYGRVAEDETSVARITAYFPARIERLFVNYLGVPVNRGEHIASVYSPELLASFEELRQTTRSLEGGTSSEIVRRSTRETLRAAREKLRLYGLTKDQIEAVETGAFEGDDFTIYSPSGGTVTHLAVRAGDYVETGDPIATVADLSRLWLDMEAYESQLPMLRWGQEVTFTVEAHPGETFTGRVSFIEPTVDTATRTTAVRVAVDNTDRRLKPGMFASATVRTKVARGGAVVSDALAGRWVGPMHPTVVRDEPGECDICGMDLVPAESLGVVGDPSTAEEPLVIPRSSVLFTGTRSVVYVKVPGNERPTYESREVVLGPRAGAFYIVNGGLGEGEEVVVNGAFRIDSAMQIAAKPSMMSPGDGGGDQPRSDVADAFVYSLKPVYSAYLDAQEALADDDFAGFVRGAEDLQRAIGFVESSALVGEALASWRRAKAKLTMDGMPGDIDAARATYERLSEGVFLLQETFGHRGRETWYRAHCPMAFDNEGADWLQRRETIDNPYFGSAMLRCGEIRATYEPLNVAAEGGGRE